MDEHAVAEQQGIERGGSVALGERAAYNAFNALSQSIGYGIERTHCEALRHVANELLSGSESVVGYYYEQAVEIWHAAAEGAGGVDIKSHAAEVYTIVGCEKFGGLNGIYCQWVATVAFDGFYESFAAQPVDVAQQGRRIALAFEVVTEGEILAE